MASVTESIISRVAAALINVSDAGARVYRHRLDSFEESELPALNVNRGEDANDPLGSNGDRVLVNFEVECLALGANWETVTDALHMQAHTALLADAPLANAVATIGAAQVEGIFDSQYADVLGFSGTTPVFECISSAVASVAQGDAIAIGGINYTISRIEPDAGMTRLVLQEV